MMVTNLSSFSQYMFRIKLQWKDSLESEWSRNCLCATASMCHFILSLSVFCTYTRMYRGIIFGQEMWPTDQNVKIFYDFDGIFHILP